MSGRIGVHDYISLINGIAEGQNTGLLTFYDVRNIPVARIKFEQGLINQIQYQGLSGATAFVELLYRKPAVGFSLSKAGQFQWSNPKDLALPAEKLITEASRRLNEIPGTSHLLGGPDACYTKLMEDYDPDWATGNGRLFTLSVLEAIDGYISLDKLPLKVGADSYTTLRVVHELAKRQVIGPINNPSPFHSNGHLGPPVATMMSFSLDAWEPLLAFYLDPLSGKPIFKQGKFSGTDSAMHPKNLLHTIEIPPKVPGALILKDQQLVGLHSGLQRVSQDQTTPPVPCYQFTWIGAVSEVHTKKVISETKMQLTNLRSKQSTVNPIVESSDTIKPYVCSNFHDFDPKTGKCKNCDAVSKLAIAAAMKEDFFTSIEKSYGIKKDWILGAASIMFLFLTFFVIRYMPHRDLNGEQEGQAGNPGMQAESDNENSSSDPSGLSEIEPDDKKAIELAQEYAGFKDTAPSGYWYKDTTNRTGSVRSFGLYSQAHNQKLLFIVMDDLSPCKNLLNFVSAPPYVKGVEKTDPGIAKIEDDLRSTTMPWFVGDYFVKDQKQHILIAAFRSPAPHEDKCILVIGRAYQPEKFYNHQTSLTVIAEQSQEFPKLAKGEPLSQNKNLSASTGQTSEESSTPHVDSIEEFDAKVASAIQAQFTLPTEGKEELKKEKSKKLKVEITVGIAHDGSVRKLDITKQSELESVNKAVIKAINAATPLANVPTTKDDLLMLAVKLNGKKIAVEKL
jgi:hypothetical protein